MGVKLQNEAINHSQNPPKPPQSSPLVTQLIKPTNIPNLDPSPSGKSIHSYNSLNPPSLNPSKTHDPDRGSGSPILFYLIQQSDVVSRTRDQSSSPHKSGMVGRGLGTSDQTTLDEPVGPSKTRLSIGTQKIRHGKPTKNLYYFSYSGVGSHPLLLK